MNCDYCTNPIQKPIKSGDVNYCSEKCRVMSSLKKFPDTTLEKAYRQLHPDWAFEFDVPVGTQLSIWR